MSDLPTIEPMDGIAYTQNEARGWHENAQQWQFHAEHLEDAIDAEQLKAANRLAALQRIEILATHCAKEPWVAAAILEVLRATFASPVSAPARWEDAMVVAMRATKGVTPPT